MSIFRVENVNLNAFDDEAFDLYVEELGFDAREDFLFTLNDTIEYTGSRDLTDVIEGTQENYVFRLISVIESLSGGFSPEMVFCLSE